MKRKFATILLGVITLIAAIPSKASTFYVLSGESFTLTPAVGTLSSYLWKLDGTAAAAGDLLPNGVYSKILTLASPTVAETHTLSLAVIDGLSCLSQAVDHTIIILPKLTVTITANQSNFCVSNDVAAILTATIQANDLALANVTLSSFAWSKDGTGISGGLTGTLNVTETGLYKALVTYVLPAGTFGSSKLGSAFTSAGTEIKHDLAIPIAPTLTIN